MVSPKNTISAKKQIFEDSAYSGFDQKAFDSYISHYSTDDLSKRNSQPMHVAAPFRNILNLNSADAL
jgi:uncharacterized protein (UPF0335 family)